MHQFYFSSCTDLLLEPIRFHALGTFCMVYGHVLHVFWSRVAWFLVTCWMCFCVLIGCYCFFVFGMNNDCKANIRCIPADVWSYRSGPRHRNKQKQQLPDLPSFAYGAFQVKITFACPPPPPEIKPSEQKFGLILGAQAEDSGVE